MQAFDSVIAAALADVRRQNIVSRIWAKDFTVWKSEPREIDDRLGWLTVASTTYDHIGELTTFADAVRAAGFQDIVVLGMGGSSLAPEVLRATFGRQPGYPHLYILDSTVPTWVRRMTASVEPTRTLFVVSSKSGGTIEVMSFFKHFYTLVAEKRGERAGDNFVAITDPGTGLQALAEKYHFWRVFLNPPDIGGRYSALSYFGMLPAALAGIPIDNILRRGMDMANACMPGTAIETNPGAWLGAALAALSRQGRDKITFVTSPGIASFGLWAEQLIAESTGKEGKGLIPIALEPFASASAYGADRLFVYLHLDGDDNAASDAHATVLEQSGQPVIRLHLQSRYDLGAEFFRWEFATALAGALLGIHPFDQPNVQESKDNTAAVLHQVQATGRMPALETTGNVTDLLSQARGDDYVALMGYFDETSEVEAAISRLRLAIMERYRLATTFGYGPRFLHSTGQLHKGGPNSGLFIQLVADWGEDVAVPGENYTFAGLAAAQALGDYASLVSHGRRVVRIHLGDEAAKGIDHLTQTIGRSTVGA